MLSTLLSPREKGLNNIDLDYLWQVEMGYLANNATEADNASVTNPRLCDDTAEESFWKDRAKTYSKTNNLYAEVPDLAHALLELILPTDHVLEIGSGTGNFTLPMAQKAQQLLAVEPSHAMLSELQRKTKVKGVKNINFVNMKWEDFPQKATERDSEREVLEPNSEHTADVIVAINSLYRIKDMRAAIAKMNTLAKKRVIIIRTLNRPMLYALKAKLNIPFDVRGDPMLYQLFLWQMGIYPHAKYFRKRRTAIYYSLDELNEELPPNISDKTKADFIKAFSQEATYQDEAYHYLYDSLYLLLYWDLTHCYCRLA